jgi:hypothetical protein
MSAWNYHHQNFFNLYFYWAKWPKSFSIITIKLLTFIIQTAFISWYILLQVWSFVIMISRFVASGWKNRRKMKKTGLNDAWMLKVKILLHRAVKKRKNTTRRGCVRTKGYALIKVIWDCSLNFFMNEVLWGWMYLSLWCIKMKINAWFQEKLIFSVVEDISLIKVARYINPHKITDTRIAIKTLHYMNKPAWPCLH